MRVPVGNPTIWLNTPARPQHKHVHGPCGAQCSSRELYLHRSRGHQRAVLRNPFSWAAPSSPSPAEAAWQWGCPIALRDTACANRTPGWRSPHAGVPLGPRCPRHQCIFHDVSTLFNCSSPLLLVRRAYSGTLTECVHSPPQCGHFQLCPHCPSSSTYSHLG